MSKSWVISKFIGTPFLERQVTWNILEHTCCLSVVSWQCPKGNLDARCLSGGGPSYAGIEQNSNHHQLSLKNSGDIMIYLSYQKKKQCFIGGTYNWTFFQTRAPPSGVCHRGVSQDLRANQIAKPWPNRKRSWFTHEKWWCSIVFSMFYQRKRL